MSEDLMIMVGYAEGLGLHRKEELNETDITDLAIDLTNAGEYGLATLVENLDKAELLNIIKEWAE